MAFAMRMGVGRKKDKKAQDEADRGDVGAAKLEVALREIYNKVDTECVRPRHPPAACALPPTEKKRGCPGTPACSTRARSGC